MLFDNIFSFASEGATSSEDINPTLFEKIPGVNPSAKVVREVSPEASAVLDFISTLTRTTQQNASTQKTYANDPGSSAQAASSVMKESSRSLDDMLEKTSTRPFPPGRPNIYGINAGGSNAVPFSFSADQYASGGTSVTTGVDTKASGILNAAPQELYKTVRYGEFTYRLPYLVPNKSYLVRLHFAEYYFWLQDQRLMDIMINNQQVLSRFDIFKEAGGPKIACVKDFPTPADSYGLITLQFKPVQDQAIVSGIEILDV